MKITVGAIKALVAEDYGVSVADIDSTDRTVPSAEPRHVAMYLAYELTRQSSTQLARAFNRKDHTTVLCACKKIARKAASNETFSWRLSALRASLVWSGSEAVTVPAIAITSYPNLDRVGFTLR